MTNYRILLLAALVITFFSPSLAELEDPPTLMWSEIKSMARFTRLPKIIFDMVNKCESTEKDQKNRIIQEWQKCITGIYAKHASTNLERITNDCTSFSKTKHCYKPMIADANSCFGENSNLFEFTTALLNYICENKEKTAELIHEKIQKFSGLEEQTSSGIDTCLAIKYHDKPHRRNETCKGLDIVDFCVDKYTAKNPNDSLPIPQNLVEFFGSMMKYLKSQLNCDKNFNDNEITTTSTQKPTVTEKSGDTSSPGQDQTSNGISLIFHQRVNAIFIYFVLCSHVLY